MHDEMVTWVPAAWKSFRLTRTVGSTLAAESQAAVAGTATAEWLSLMITEAREGPFMLREATDQFRKVPITLVTDCKSMFYHVVSRTSPSAVTDRRCSIDLAILKQAADRTGMVTRWCPTALQLADGLTKDKFEPVELLRACIQLGAYQLSSTTLLAKALAHRWIHNKNGGFQNRQSNSSDKLRQHSEPESHKSPEQG